jgi:2-phospho-L-lactate guanylyltransferase
MNAVLIPVRSMTGAKNRLAASLDESARTRLTLAMLADMICAARAAQFVDAVYVVSGDRSLLERAQGLGAQPLEETQRGHGPDPSRIRGGLNRAVFAAATALERRGVDRLLTIPGDVPLIAPAEVDDLFASATGADVVLAPAGTGTGTNGLLASPPAVVVPRFEGESLRAHVRACEDAGLSYAVRALAGFALDIDTADDLRTLAGSGADRESARVALELLDGADLRTMAGT